MSVNGSIPGPTLYFKEGDTARINIKNNMNVNTSVHWHGLLLPNRQDGVSYLTTPPIVPGMTYTYEFPIKHSGTYWYHSHTGLQEQKGVYGSIVIEPKEKRSDIEEPEIEQVIVLSDWTDQDPHEVLRDLKKGSEYQSFKKGSTQTVLGVIQNKAIMENLKRSLRRMPPMDISDVAYDAFLINGQPKSTLKLERRKKVRLRIINAGASTYFYLNYAGGDMEIISADGVDVEPLEKDSILIAVAETYDVIVTVPKEGAYEFRATAQDGSGHASLFIGEGEQVLAQDIPKPNLYKMDHSQMMMGSNTETDHSKMEMDHSMHGDMQHESMDMPGEMKMTGNPRPLPPYKDLRALESTELPSQNKDRVVVLNLTGDMERYVWSINGMTLNENDKILIRKGENVTFVMNNKTMMHHPMHLHGHFFRVLNDQGEYSPLKHTVDVAPLSTTVIEFEANEEKDWFFHCHVLYHMKSGMSRIVSYEGSVIDPDIKEIRANLYKDPLYYWADFRILSQMTDGIAAVSNTRNTISARWEAGWEDEEYEIELTYNRYINRFITVFGGLDITNEEQQTRGIFGVRYLLPLLIDSTVWVDTDADFRIILDKEMHLTERLSAFGELQYDTESKWEWKAGGAIMINKWLSLVGQYYSEFGAGSGIEIRL
jgi:FtsP/CotA-like multicopper oxidase with cupredoxin domain